MYIDGFASNGNGPGQNTATVSVYKNPFLPRTIQEWNRRPAQVTDSDQGVQSA